MPCPYENHRPERLDTERQRVTQITGASGRRHECVEKNRGAAKVGFVAAAFRRAFWGFDYSRKGGARRGGQALKAAAMKPREGERLLLTVNC